MPKNKPIYLDYNATAPIKTSVIEEMVEVMSEVGNASSVHSLGRKAKMRLENARAAIADMLNCRAAMISFTSGGTEANNMAFLSSQLKGREITRLIVSAAEHDSFRGSYKRFKGEVLKLSLDENGLVSKTELKTILGDDGSHTLVSILYVNNETGVIQDIKSLTEITHEAGALFHTDAIQALGKIMVDYKELGVDMMSISSHKIGGPQGAGAFIAREALEVSPLISGGGQESGRRSGTENLAGIVGFAKAVSLVPQNLQKIKKLTAIRDDLEARIIEFAPDSKIFGKDSNRVGTVSNIMMPNVMSETQVIAFDLAGICISAGSACSSGKVKSSHVISQMGANETEASSTIRMSLGWDNTAQEVDAFYQAWIKLYMRKKKT
jgi:cysteine desulfurase